MKYIPYRLYPRIKPRIIDDIVKDNDIIGKVAGVNLKPIRFDYEKELKEYIIGIKKLNLEGFTKLYLEEWRGLPKETISYMESEIGLKIDPDEYAKIPYIPLVIESIFNILDEDLENKEILVMSKEKEISKRIIKELSKITKFITFWGCNMEDSEEIYEYILEETGLSLFNSSNIDKILGKYSIIVNDIDDFKLEPSKIKKNTIIINFNRKDQEYNKNFKLYGIGNFGFDLNDLGFSNNKWLESKLDIELYNFINEDNLGEVKYLYVESNWYSLREYTNLFIKLKGKL